MKERKIIEKKSNWDCGKKHEHLNIISISNRNI
jgi:hypothetical protein